MSIFLDYIQRRQAELGITQNQIAHRAGKSTSWISNLLNLNRKDIKVDTLIALAKALEVPEIKLISAYKGKDPDAVEPMPQPQEPVMPAPDPEAEALKSSFRVFIQSLPASVILEMVDPMILVQAIRAHDGEEKFQALLAEAQKLKGGKKK